MQLQSLLLGRPPSYIVAHLSHHRLLLQEFHLHIGQLSELVVRLVIIDIVVFRLSTVGCQDHEVQVSLVLDLRVLGRLNRFLSVGVLARHDLMVITFVV